MRTYRVRVAWISRTSSLKHEAARALCSPCFSAGPVVGAFTDGARQPSEAAGLRLDRREAVHSGHAPGRGERLVAPVPDNTEVSLCSIAPYVSPRTRSSTYRGTLASSSRSGAAFDHVRSGGGVEAGVDGSRSPRARGAPIAAAAALPRSRDDEDLVT